MRINNRYSLYKTGKKLTPFVEKKYYGIGLLAFKSEKNFLLEDYFIKTLNPPFNVRREL